MKHAHRVSGIHFLYGLYMYSASSTQKQVWLKKRNTTFTVVRWLLFIEENLDAQARVCKVAKGRIHIESKAFGWFFSTGYYFIEYIHSMQECMSYVHMHTYGMDFW